MTRLVLLAGWERLPAAYLSFGDTYAEERAEAVLRLLEEARRD